MDAPFSVDMMPRITKFFETESSREPGQDIYEEVFKTDTFFPLQRKKELVKMLNVARGYNPKVIYEIGTCDGGGLYHWCKSVVGVERVIASEIRGTPYQHEFEKAASVQKAGKPAAQASIDCTVYAPCTPHEKPDGSTEKAFVPRGKNVCFDNSFWENITRLGERISYQGGPEEEYRCTREEVLSGACGTRVFDTFRFTPEKGVRPPRYWFIGEQQHEC